MGKNKVRYKEVYRIKLQASLPGVECRHVIYISSKSFTTQTNLIHPYENTKYLRLK
jgi:hypothetical protein